MLNELCSTQNKGKFKKEANVLLPSSVSLALEYRGDVTGERGEVTVADCTGSPVADKVTGSATKGSNTGAGVVE